MEPLLSAKGSDVMTWRAVENFTGLYRDALLNLAGADGKGDSEAVFAQTCSALEAAIAVHRKFLKQLKDLIANVAAATPATDLKELTTDFYNCLYLHFGHFRSVPVFYQLSMDFLHQASVTIITQATEQLGPGVQLPEIALIALGPAGRYEYSPFCPLQVLLVHGESSPSQARAIELLCDAIHEGFEKAGMAVDPVITPRNSRWRGTLADWQQHYEDGLHPESDEEIVDLCRLADQYPLHSAGEGLATDLKQLSQASLSVNRPALTNFVERIAALSNGLGMMGRLKLERSGSGRGFFRLLDHGLLPYSAALSALALLRKCQAATIPERIHDLLKRHELRVELAEQMLATWHTLHGLRLRLEQSFQIDLGTKPDLFLNPNEFTIEQRQTLKKTLESVATIQQHVTIIFSGMGE